MAVCFTNNLAAQQVTCTQLGQNPSTAFPVCGNKELHQDEVPLCGERPVAVPCESDLISDKNPFWYRFTCYNGGTLGFEITPEEENDDYDWQLFDITGHNPEEVYTNPDLFVACNWSGEFGVTGASEIGNSLTKCDGIGVDLFTSMPTLIEGHEYLLLVSHWLDSQSGYTLEFKGGTANITDPKIAAPEKAYGSCSGNEVYLKLNKAMLCNSIARDGSDFEIDGAAVNILSARSAACNNGFNTDSIVVTLDAVLPLGNYTIRIKEGNDTNTLLDDCDIQMAPAQVNFTVYQDVSATFTYQAKTGCLTDTVTYMHDGANQVNSWNWVFNDGISIEQNPVMYYKTAGSKNAELIVSNGYCSDTASLSMEIAPKIDAAFSAPEIVCMVDPALFVNNSSGDIVSYRWAFGNGENSGLRDPGPVKYGFSPGEKKYTVTLEVEDDKGCTDMASASMIVVGNCNIVVPSAFTPNRDGRNDELFPSNAFNADNLLFRVYNRFGQIVFESRDWRKKWDGNVNGQAQPIGTYIWTMTYTLKTTGKPYVLKGTTVLIR